jgi:hypothetical protein
MAETLLSPLDTCYTATECKRPIYTAIICVMNLTNSFGSKDIGQYSLLLFAQIVNYLRAKNHATKNILLTTDVDNTHIYKKVRLPLNRVWRPIRL